MARENLEQQAALKSQFSELLKQFAANNLDPLEMIKSLGGNVVKNDKVDILKNVLDAKRNENHNTLLQNAIDKVKNVKYSDLKSAEDIQQYKDNIKALEDLAQDINYTYRIKRDPNNAGKYVIAATPRRTITDDEVKDILVDNYLNTKYIPSQLDKIRKYNKVDKEKIENSLDEFRKFLIENREANGDYGSINLTYMPNDEDVKGKTKTMTVGVSDNRPTDFIYHDDDLDIDVPIHKDNQLVFRVPVLNYLKYVEEIPKRIFGDDSIGGEDNFDPLKHQVKVTGRYNGTAENAVTKSAQVSKGVNFGDWTDFYGKPETDYAYNLGSIYYTNPEEWERENADLEEIAASYGMSPESFRSYSALHSRRNGPRNWEDTDEYKSLKANEKAFRPVHDIKIGNVLDIPEDVYSRYLRTFARDNDNTDQAAREFRKRSINDIIDKVYSGLDNNIKHNDFMQEILDFDENEARKRDIIKLVSPSGDMEIPKKLSIHNSEPLAKFIDIINNNPSAAADIVALSGNNNILKAIYEDTLARRNNSVKQIMDLYNRDPSSFLRDAEAETLKAAEKFETDKARNKFSVETSKLIDDKFKNIVKKLNDDARRAPILRERLSNYENLADETKDLDALQFKSYMSSKADNADKFETRQALLDAIDTVKGQLKDYGTFDFYDPDYQKKLAMLKKAASDYPIRLSDLKRQLKEITADRDTSDKKLDSIASMLNSFDINADDKDAIDKLKSFDMEYKDYGRLIKANSDKIYDLNKLKDEADKSGDIDTSNKLAAEIDALEDKNEQIYRDFEKHGVDVHEIKKDNARSIFSIDPDILNSDNYFSNQLATSQDLINKLKMLDDQSSALREQISRHPQEQYQNAMHSYADWTPEAKLKHWNSIIDTYREPVSEADKKAGKLGKLKEKDFDLDPVTGQITVGNTRAKRNAEKNATISKNEISPDKTITANIFKNKEYNKNRDLLAKVRTAQEMYKQNVGYTKDGSDSIIHPDAGLNAFNTSDTFAPNNIGKTNEEVKEQKEARKQKKELKAKKREDKKVNESKKPLSAKRNSTTDEDINDVYTSQVSEKYNPFENSKREE